jgi:hypothetical protein
MPWGPPLRGFARLLQTVDYITKDMERSNVTIMCDVTVDKVIIERGPNNSLRATGVEHLDNTGNMRSF